MADDDLYELRNFLHLGNYAAAWEEGATLEPSTEGARQERDVLMALCELGRGTADRLTALPPDAPISLRALKFLGEYLSRGGDADEAPQVLDALQALTASAAASCDPDSERVARMATACVHARLSQLPEAYAAIASLSHPEAGALRAHLLLQMRRPELARRELDGLQAVDEDSALCQLVRAEMGICSDEREHVEDALYTLQELTERHGATGALLNATAVCHLKCGQEAAAERALQQAQTRDAHDADALVNRIALAMQQLQPAEWVQSQVERLRALAPLHPWLRRYEEMREAVERECGSVM
ncbi:hypothetical protein CDCA_CDCA10G2860 [Cyanidium caldarium]|uniref:Coatomer subunit epsilon n=1 Tax=Cyanidium caldarium TaxID=2771 RepID=A0AAV9IXM5_CYACA|nr:hypothetical protein CDCA_CDCA10G2860 [Cyanidium caldarium]|eukprot:ctg_2849.g533